MPFFAGSTGRVHYRSWNTDGARAGIVFAHGFRQHSAHYHRFAAGLGAHGLALWSLDLAGHGLSEGEPGVPGDTAAHARDLRTLAGIAEGNRLPLVLMGHSLGAASAVTLLTGDPRGFSGAVLCGTPRGVAVAETTGPLSASGLPILAVHGVDDRLAPVEPVRTWAASVPALTLVEYPDAGHDLLHEPVHRTVTGDIVAFVDEVTRTDT